MRTIIKQTIMKKICYSVLGLIACYSATAQENQFVVYSAKGSVDIVQNNTTTKARIGTIVTEGAQVKIGPGAFATLICNETKAFTLNKAGSYATANLKDSCKVGSGSLSSNYMKYVWNEMTKPKGSPEKNRKNYMSNVGAVSRNINNVWIDPKLDTVNYVSGTVPLSWKSFTEAEDFEFKLFDKQGAYEPILVRNVKKKHIEIKDILASVKSGNTYYWTAMVKGEDNEDRKLFKYWTKEDYTTYYNSIKNSGGTSETEADKNFRLGFILEEAHFLVEAYDHYLKATQLAPDNIFFRSTFMSFKKDYEIK
jgi:hypothetical protein